MTFWELLGNVLYKKHHVQLNIEEEQLYNAYMFNRWASMYSVDMVPFVNETLNRYSSVFTTKQEQYDFMMNIVPQLRWRKLNYIKRKKDTEEELDFPVDISKRELKIYQDLLNSICAS